MPAFICTACGTQYPPSDVPPGACPSCIDERQFVPASYGAFSGRGRIDVNGKQVVAASVARYIARIETVS